MSTTTTKSVLKQSSLKLINPKSFFDVNVNCPTVFDRDIIIQIESGSKSCQIDIPNLQNTFENIAKLLIPLSKTKIDHTHLPLLRNSLFYYIMMMDFLTDHMEKMMSIQLIALDLNEFYCNILDENIKTNPRLVQAEIDKVLTFQSSSNCATPNILKENFLEMSKSKAIKDFVKAKFQDVDFGQPSDEYVEEFDNKIEENVSELYQQIMSQMAQLESKPKKSIVKKPSKNKKHL